MIFHTPSRLISGVPHVFLYYYIPKRYTDHNFPAFTPEIRDIQHKIWFFKDGMEQEWAVNALANVLNTLGYTGHTHQNLALACIPASTRRANNLRYAYFSEVICQHLNLYNGFDHVKIIKEKEPNHCTGVATELELNFDANFFAGKNVIVFDDIVTKGHSMYKFIQNLRAVKATPIVCLSLGYTYYPEKTTVDPINPYTGTHVLQHGELIEDNRAYTQGPFQPLVQPKTSIAVNRIPQATSATSMVINTTSSAPTASTTSSINVAAVTTAPKSVPQPQTAAATTVKQVPISALAKEQIKNAKQHRTILSTLKKGDTLTLGSFYGKPLVWEVLACDDIGSTLIISKYGITCRAYNNKDELTSWETCSLRQWLNGSFLNMSFSDYEKSRIVTSHVNAEVVFEHELYPGNDTEDNIYILSINEYLRYYGDTNHWRCFLLDAPRTKRQCWLRNYGADRSRAAFIGRSGRIHEGGSLITSTRNTIRPVMRIKG